MTPETTTWWQEKRWNGCLNRPVPESSSSAHCALRSLQAKHGSLITQHLSSPFGWFQWAIPTINQHGPSCVGQAWANWLELMIRRYVSFHAFKPGEQLDGYALWTHARNRFWNGDLSGGLYLHQGFEAALDLGFLPPGSRLRLVGDDPESIFNAIPESPLVQAHTVHEGWYFTDPRNGCIDHSQKPGPDSGAHATLLCATLISPENQPFYVAQNSWGRTYGWNGYFTMAADHWSDYRVNDGPYTVDLPPDWIQWTGWQRHITRSAR